MGEQVPKRIRIDAQARKDKKSLDRINKARKKESKKIEKKIFRKNIKRGSGGLGGSMKSFIRNPLTKMLRKRTR